jgi:hypothetical protein
LTLANIRAITGIESTLISDADQTIIGEQAEYELERLLNTSFSLKTVIEKYEGDGTNRLVLKNNPVLKLRSLEIDSTSVSVAYVEVDRESGVIWLEESAEKAYFTQKELDKKLVFVKYDYGQLEDTSVQTTTTSAAAVGSSVSIAVSSSASFTVNNYARIIGMDGYEETFQITAKADSTHLTADNLALSHESGSIVVEVAMPEIAKRLGYVITGLMSVARVVGASYDEVVGYTAGEIEVQKGEPYTQWRETATQLRHEYDSLLRMIRPRPTIR